MTYTLLNPPSAAPVTLADAKAYLRVTHDSEDSLISSLIDTAVQYLERDTGQALIDQQWRAYAECLPANRTLELLKAPVRGIVAITAYDGGGNATVLDGADYYVNLAARPARVRFGDSVATSITANGIEIDFDAGYGEAGADVPDMLKRAVLTLVAHWFEFRSVYDASDHPVSVPALYARLTRHFRLARL